MWSPPPSRIRVVIARCGIPHSRTSGDSGHFTTCNFGSQSFYYCKETFTNWIHNLLHASLLEPRCLFCCGSVSQKVYTDCSAVAKSRAVNLLYNLLDSAWFSIHTVFPVCLQLSVHCAAASIVTVISIGHSWLEKILAVSEGMLEDGPMHNTVRR
jgi:hypothetical protein